MEQLSVLNNKNKLNSVFGELMDINYVTDLIINSRYIIVFTGAGISAESGIPTFRGKGGLWERYDPAKYATITALRKNPDKVWKLYKELFYLIKNSKPNPAHYAVSRLEELNIVKSVITQNVDDLHEKAGSKNVIKLHGSYDELRCEKCGHIMKINDIDFDSIPICPICGNTMRPNVVFFGESLPAAELELAFKEASKADLVMAIGTSGVVVPAAYIPWIVKNNNGRVIEINFEPSAITNMADASLFGKAGEILPKISELIEKKLNLNTRNR